MSEHTLREARHLWYGLLLSPPPPISSLTKLVLNSNCVINISILIRGGSRGGGGDPRGQDPLPPFWGTPKLHKEGKTLHACAPIGHVLVLNSYLNTPPPPFSEILYPPLNKGATKEVAVHAFILRLGWMNEINRRYRGCAVEHSQPVLYFLNCTHLLQSSIGRPVGES